MAIRILRPEPAAALAPAKQRILDAADALFYVDGIRGTGVDAVILAAGVTKATFYKHYVAKERLVLAYLDHRHRRIAGALCDAVERTDSGRAALDELRDGIVGELEAPGFRGDAFLDAAAEYPHAADPVREAVRAHRDWYADALQQLLADAGHPLPGDAADEFMLARDGAMSGAYAGDPVAASSAFVRAADRIVHGRD